MLGYDFVTQLTTIFSPKPKDTNVLGHSLLRGSSASPATSCDNSNVSLAPPNPGKALLEILYCNENVLMPHL